MGNNHNNGNTDTPNHQISVSIYTQERNENSCFVSFITLMQFITNDDFLNARHQFS